MDSRWFLGDKDGGFPKNAFRNQGRSTHGVFPLFSSMACIHIMGNQALFLRWPKLYIWRCFFSHGGTPMVSSVCDWDHHPALGVQKAGHPWRLDDWDPPWLWKPPFYLPLSTITNHFEPLYLQHISIISYLHTSTLCQGQRIQGEIIELQETSECWGHASVGLDSAHRCHSEPKYIGLVGGLEHFFNFPYIGNFIIPTDFHIFQRGRSTTNQLIIWDYVFPFMI